MGTSNYSDEFKHDAQARADKALRASNQNLLFQQTLAFQPDIVTFF